VRTEPEAEGRFEGLSLILVSTFIVLAIALTAVSIWAIIRLVLHYT
jgi:hypothetical protein